MSRRRVRQVHVGPLKARESLAQLQDLDRRMRRWKADYEQWRYSFNERFGDTPLYKKYWELRADVRHIADAVRLITKAYRQRVNDPIKPGGDIE